MMAGQTLQDPARYPFSIIRERMRECPNVLDFAFGRGRPQPPSTALDRIGRESARIARRASASQIKAVAERAGRMLQRQYLVDIDPDSILPAPSGRAAIAGLATTVTRPGDRVLVVEPVYPTIGHVSATLGARVEQFWLSSGSSFVPDVRELASSLCGVRLCALSFPNNPTGAVMPASLAEAAAGALAQEGVLFNDATYGPLTYAQQPRSALTGIAAGGPTVVELHTLSKLFGLEGLGIAFLAGTAQAISSVRTYSEYAWTPLNELQAVVAAECLEDSAAIESLRSTYAARVERLVGALTSLGLNPFPAPSGLYVLCPTPARIGGRATSSAWEAAGALLECFSLAVMPWSGPNGGWLRFSAMHHDDDLDRLLELDLLG